MVSFKSDVEVEYERDIMYKLSMLVRSLGMIMKLSIKVDVEVDHYQ